MSAHTVERLRFEMDVATAAQGLALQESISALHATALEPLLDAFLSDLVPEDRFLRLETLKLDLGSLTMEQATSELAPRIEAALSSAVISSPRGIGIAPPGMRERSVPLGTEQLHQLENFLERGVLSFSAGSRTLGLNALLDALIIANPEALRSALLNHRNHVARCKRLAAQFSRPSRMRLLRMLLRERADVTVGCIDALQRLQRYRPLVAATASQFETALWTAVLDFVLLAQHAIFDESAFVRQVIRGLSARLRVTPEALAAGLLARMRLVALEFSVRSLLEHSLSSLAALPAAGTQTRAIDGRGEIPEGETQTLSSTTQPVDEVAALIHLLRKGVLPARDHDFALASSQQWLTTMLREQPARLIAALKQIGDRADAIRRLVESFDWDALSALIQKLEPDYAGFILTYLLAGERFATQRPGVRTAHWCAALGWLLDPHGQRFEAASFVNVTSYHSARRLNVSHRDYLEGLLECARAASRDEQRFAPLLELLSASLDGAEIAISEVITAKTSPHQPGVENRSTADQAPLSQPSRKQLRDTAFLTRYFLQYGLLPRHADVTHVSELHRRIDAALVSRPRPMKALLISAALQPLPRARMAALFPAALMDNILHTIAPGAAPQVSNLLRLLGKHRRRSALQLLLPVIAARAGHRTGVEKAIKESLRQLARAESLSYPHLLAQLRESSDQYEGDAAVDVRRLIERLADEAQADSLLDGASPLPVDVESAPGQGEVWEFPEDEPNFVGNAGLVLLWPFLSRYFETLGMLEDGQFRDAACRHRAVYLLQYLAGGNADGAEYELLLNKIICGVDAFEPLDTGIEMTETESHLSRELLHGVCQNWPPLRNTSIDGLREAFLRREGRLLLKEESWSLAVSEKSYDMLLDRLPWNLSMIRLPWMKSVLSVAWR